MIQQNFQDIAVQFTLDDVRDAFAYGAENGASKKELAKEDDVISALKNLGLPGRLGSGEYSKKQLGIFNQIELALGKGKPVTISTHKYIITAQGKRFFGLCRRTKS